MSHQLNGTEFAARVADNVGRTLENAELIAILYDAALGEGNLTEFKDLAMYAKSFQKISRLLSSERAGDDTREAARAELESLIRQFADQVGSIVVSLPEDKRREISDAFLIPTTDSFRNLTSLIEDFARVKDFMLLERDRGTRH